MSRGLSLEEAYKTIGIRELNTWKAHWMINGPFDGSRIDWYMAQQAALSLAPHVKDPHSIKRTDYMIWGVPEKRQQTSAEMMAVLDQARRHQSGVESIRRHRSTN